MVCEWGGKVLNGLGLFAGIGGLDLGLERAGLVRSICFVENDTYAQKVLALRFPQVAIWDDVKTFDGREWAGEIDFISGGFPCQDVSVAGKQAGLGGSRSGLWKEFRRIIGEIRPLLALIENVPGLFNNGFDAVLADLAEIGYDAEWTVLSAKDMGAPHLRKRVFILGYAHRAGFNGAQKRESLETGSGSGAAGKDKAGEFARSSKQSKAMANANGTTRRKQGNTSKKIIRSKKKQRLGRCGQDVANTKSERKRTISKRQRAKRKRTVNFDGRNETAAVCNAECGGCGGKPRRGAGAEFADRHIGEWWTVEPALGRVAHGVPARVDRLKCLGNAVVPQCAEYIGRTIMRAIKGGADDGE